MARILILIMPPYTELAVSPGARTKNPSQSSVASADSGIGVAVEQERPIYESVLRSLPSAADGRVIYLSRHGESLYNLENRIGGNPRLSPRGLKYARALGAYINGLEIPGLKVTPR